MKCPIDNAELQMTERQNIEIDYCPTCRGVWLDRGELDKLIERSETIKPERVQQSYKEEGHSSRGKHGYKKREGFLGDLFDF